MSSTDTDRLAALYTQIREAQAEMDALLRATAAGAVDDVTFEGPDGPVRLSELFGDQDDLILSFNMGSHCAYCTLWADEANGVLKHLTRRAAFVVTSPEAPAAQQAVAAKRGWAFPMVSHGNTRFAVDEGFAQHDGERFTSLMPGFETFHRDDDGTIRRTGRSFYGPGDPYCSVYHFFALLEDGVGGWSPRV